MTIETPAGQVSAELERRGIGPDIRVRVTIELMDRDFDGAAIAQSGGAFGWLADEPDLYTDRDVVEPRT